MGERKIASEKKKGKRKIWIAVAIIILLLILLLFFLFRDRERIISVLEYEGTADVERQGIDDKLDVFEGMRLEEGDYLETGSGSSVTMAIDDDKVARLAENSRASYREIAEGRGGRLTNIYLEKGTLINDLEDKLRKNEVYKVTTPNATVSVRGTYFVVYVGPEEGYDGIITRVNVYKGSVEVENSAGEVQVLYADDSIEAGIKSMITLPFGNRAIIGIKSMTIYKGLDYKGLKLSDLDRLEQFAGLEDSAVKLVDIEKQREFLLDSVKDDPAQLINGLGQGEEGGADVASQTSEAAEELARELQEAGEGLRRRKDSAKQEINKFIRDKNGTLNRVTAPEIAVVDSDRNTGYPDQGIAVPTGGSSSGNPQYGEGSADRPSGGGSNTGGSPSSDGSSSGGTTGSGSSAGGSSGGTTGSGSSAGGSSGGTSGGGASTDSSSSGSSSTVVTEAEKYAPARLAIRNYDTLRQEIQELKGRAEMLLKVVGTGPSLMLEAAKREIAETEALLDSVDNVNLVLDKVNALPLPSQTTSANAVLIADARAAYDTLSAEEKALVPDNLLEKLEKCEAAD